MVYRLHHDMGDPVLVGSDFFVTVTPVCGNGRGVDAVRRSYPGLL